MEKFNREENDQFSGFATSGTGGYSAHLRKVLNIMFPSAYIELYHSPPNSICSLFSTRCWPQNSPNGDTDDNASVRCCYEASTEPSSRASLICLREHLNASLAQHQAKSVGLCAIRRAIYDQCFDEIIRQVTVSCIEQGLLLFRIRNELRMTINYFRKAYLSGVEFGLSKAIDAEVDVKNYRAQIQQLEKSKRSFTENCYFKDRISEVELKNKLESVDRMKEYYEGEITRRDQVIEQQRAIIRALSQRSTADIKSPI